MVIKSDLIWPAVLAVILGACGNPGTAPADNTVPQPEDGTNQVLSTIMDRRSIRRYKDTPVDRNLLDTIVRCGINAPSAMNKQPWQVRVVDSKEFIDGITSIYVAADSSVAADPEFKNMFRNAPAVIFIASPSDGTGQLDCGLLGENMILAAHSLGLGTCCLGGPVRFIKSSAEAAPYVDRLDIPEGYELLYAIAVGYPDETPDPRPRETDRVMFVD